MGAVGLTLAVGEETLGRKLSEFCGVGDLVGSRSGEKKEVADGPMDPKSSKVKARRVMFWVLRAAMMDAPQMVVASRCWEGRLYFRLSHVM